jgi:hypothetical protein
VYPNKKKSIPFKILKEKNILNKKRKEKKKEKEKKTDKQPPSHN